MQSGINSMQRQGNSIFYTSSIQQQRAEKCGWLKKQGGVVKSWHRRWFTIKGDHMFYFNANDETKPPLGCIFLPGNKVIEYPLSGTEADKFIFEIIPGTYLLCLRIYSSGMTVFTGFLVFPELKKKFFSPPPQSTWLSSLCNFHSYFSGFFYFKGHSHAWFLSGACVKFFM